MAACGAAVIAVSVQEIHSSGLWSKWLPLAALTLLSGSATVKLPSVPATISVSETFVFTAVLLFGPAAGAVIDALDGLIISLWLGKGRKEWYQVAFNVTAPALSIWCAAQVYFAFGVQPVTVRPQPIETLIFPLAAFATTHFLLNTWLVAFAVSFQLRQSALALWRRDFLWLSLNYFGGASVAALLAVYSRDVSPVFLGVIVPLLLVLYFSFKIPMARVEDSHRHVAKVNSLYMSTIETLALAVDAKDQVTHGHIRRVQSHAVGLAKALGIKDEGLLKAIEASALLHDMGKLAVPEHILNKPGKLTAAEFEKMKLHAPVGAEILSAIDFPYPVVPIVRHHHENWDGTGYPDGLVGSAIPIGARILSVVDCYDALTSDRPYRARLSHEEAIAILVNRRATMYDPLVVDTFVRLYGHAAPEVRETSVSHVLERPGDLRYSVAGAGSDASTSQDERPWAVTIDSAKWSQLRLATNASAVVLSAYDSIRDELVVCSVYGLDDRSLRRKRIPLGQGVIGWVAANHRTLVNSEPMLDLAGLGLAMSDLTAGLVLPISSGAVLLGVLALYSSEEFSTEQRRHAELAAASLADAFLRNTPLDNCA